MPYRQGVPPTKRITLTLTVRHGLGAVDPEEVLREVVHGLRLTGWARVTGRDHPARTMEHRGFREHPRVRTYRFVLEPSPLPSDIPLPPPNPGRPDVPPSFSDDSEEPPNASCVYTQHTHTGVYGVRIHTSSRPGDSP